MGLNRNVWAIFVASGIFGLGLYALRLRPEIESALLVTYSSAAALAIFLGVSTYRPKPLAGWVLLGVGQALNAFGDFFFTRALYLQIANTPEWLFEGAYLAGQVCFIAGLGQILYAYRSLISKNAVTQGAMMVIGLITLVWVQQISPNIGQGLGGLEWARLLVYPAFLLVIFSAASVYLMTGMGKNWSYLLIFFSALVYSVALGFYSQMIQHGGAIFAPGAIHLAYLGDLSYSLAYLLIGTAFLHPSLAEFQPAQFEKGDRISRSELLILAAAFWVGPVAHLLNSRASITSNEIVVLASMLIIFSLNQWRLARLVHVLEEQNKELSLHREMLHHQAFHDALTGLPNRASLYNHLELLIEETRLRGTHGAVFLIDVNNFKQVNDTLGHDEGDRVLKEVSSAFSSLKRKEDVVGRWGGDEFMMVLKNLPDEVSAKALARRLQQEIRWTVSGSEGSVVMSISIGICLIPTGSEKLQTIVKKADLALYQAKRMPEIGIAVSGW